MDIAAIRLISFGYERVQKVCTSYLDVDSCPVMAQEYLVELFLRKRYNLKFKTTKSLQDPQYVGIFSSAYAIAAAFRSIG